MCRRALITSWLALLALPALAQQLPGTKPLEAEGDLAEAMVAGIDKFLLRQTEQAVTRRASLWKRDFSSHEAYLKSVAPNRARLGKYLGVVDEREKVTGLQYIHQTDSIPLWGRGDGYEILAVRWPVLPGVTGEGLLLRPKREQPQAFIVALPDADQTPEMLVGLAPGVSVQSQFARRFAESGCLVVVPYLIDRGDAYSVVKNGRETNQPHREFVYRGAFEMGRHIIGYEIQKVLAVVDYFHAQAEQGTDPAVGVFGYGEGGLVALYAGALDTRIDKVGVSGYFNDRQRLWEEPIYRNVWALLQEFGDAEVATLVAPRPLLIEACEFPKVEGPPQPQGGRNGAAPGKLSTPPLEVVQGEVDRARKLLAPLGPPAVIDLVATVKGSGPPGSDLALTKFLENLGGKGRLAPRGDVPAVTWNERPDYQIRRKQQVDELVEHVQRVMRESEFTRAKFWSQADAGSLEAWKKSCEFYRNYLEREVIGRFDLETLPPNPRTRQVYDEEKYTGYEVMLDVWPDVYAYGILLVPKNIAEGERRPVVVCQHGLEGRPQDVADPKHVHKAYNQYACRLAEQGFLTYAPQNPYIGKDKFRTLQRKANPLKTSLFSIIVPQHRVTTDWLASLPFVDPDRIGFYGLSYGGKTAMRVPPLVPRYALSICSADFNQWIWKNVSAHHRYSYLGTGEYEMFEFDLGNTFNYAELAWLIAPRPFMVERGHHDGVAPDEWVAYEFARVRNKYAALKIPDRTTIEFFDGPHSIHAVGTFEFLHKHLKWPPPAE